MRDLFTVDVSEVAKVLTKSIPTAPSRGTKNTEMAYVEEKDDSAEGKVDSVEEKDAAVINQ